MYGIPADTNLDFLLSAEVTGVLFGYTTVILNFFPEAHIMIDCEVSFGLDADRTDDFVGQEISQSFFGLLGKNVQHAAVASEKCLILKFVSGQSLCLYDSNEHFESFVITNKDVQIVV